MLIVYAEWYIESYVGLKIFRRIPIYRKVSVTYVFWIKPRTSKSSSIVFIGTTYRSTVMFHREVTDNPSFRIIFTECWYLSNG